MYYSVTSGTIDGMQGAVVHVEVDASNGMPYFSMVGYLSHEVREAKERVIAALRTVGFSLPPKRITVSLSPADMKKAGASFDLPIAVAILGSFSFFPRKQLEGAFVAGELGLAGNVHEAKGILPMLLSAKAQGITTCYVPAENAQELKTITGLNIYLVHTLQEMVDFLRGNIQLEQLEHQGYDPGPRPEYPDFSSVCGQKIAKRALEIAAVGRHNIMLLGPAGCGKSMLANCLMSIMPALSEEESQEVEAIYSAFGKHPDHPNYPPFRTPHHTISYSAFLGGGMTLKAGEITLAHNGVLLIDEMPELRRNCLEGLREPMQNHKISISRTNGHFEFPADAMIIATANPCPCGNYPDRIKCHCSDLERKRYISKITRPIMERFDMIINMERVEVKDIKNEEEKSEEIRKRIIYGRNRQKRRNSDVNYACNSRIPAIDIEKVCHMDADTKELSLRLYKKNQLSMREYHHMLKVARTIADMDGAEAVGPNHLTEASMLYNTSFLMEVTG